MFDLKMLSPDERAEYELILESATHDEDGIRKTSEFGAYFLVELQRAVAAGKEWAQWLIEDSAEAGLQKRAKEWLRSRQFITVENGEQVIVTKSALIGVRKKSGHQQVLWNDLCVEELWEVARRATARRNADALELSIAARLIDLCTAQQTSSVAVALAAIGMTLDEFLAS